jgi:hypothetical protein
MITVFILQHEYEWCGRDEVKFIGVYATHDDAQAAIRRLCDQVGFKDWPDGFSIDEYELGVDHWTEGFVTMVNILIPSRTNPNRYHIAGSIWRPGDLYAITDIADPGDAIFEVGNVVRCRENVVPNHGDHALVAFEVIRDSMQWNRRSGQL